MVGGSPQFWARHVGRIAESSAGVGRLERAERFLCQGVPARGRGDAVRSARWGRHRRCVFGVVDAEPLGSETWPGCIVVG